MTQVRKQLFYFIVHTSVGVVALCVALPLNLQDGFKQGVISGIAGGFLATGGIGIIVSVRLLRNPRKAAAVTTAKTEERTQFIRMKTYSAVHTTMLYPIAIGTLIAGLAGYREISLTLAAILVLQTILYFIFVRYYWIRY